MNTRMKIEISPNAFISLQPPQVGLTDAQAMALLTEPYSEFRHGFIVCHMREAARLLYEAEPMGNA